MANEEKEELKLKRLKLQEELHQKEVRQRVAPQIAHLEKLGEEHSVYNAYEHLNWIDTHVQVRKRDGYNGSQGDFQIDVIDSEAVKSLTLKEVEIRSEKFKELFTSFVSEENTMIICYEGGDPELEISTKVFLDDPNVYFSNPETWILSSEKEWLVEYIWDQGVIRFIQLSSEKPTLYLKICIEG